MLKYIKRLFLYQIFLVLFYMRYRNLEKSALEFKDRVYGLTSTFKFNHQFIDQAFKDPVMFFQVYSIASVVFAGLAMLGANFFGLLCAIILAINTVVYEVKFPKLEGRSFNLMDLQNILTFDVLLNIIVIFGILTCVFSSGKGDVEKIQPEQVNEKNDRNQAPSSKKNKKNL